MVPEPAAAVGAAVRVKVPGLVGLAGVNDAVTPARRPLNDRFTASLKPLVPVTVTIAPPLLLCATLKLVDESESEKSGGGVTVKATVVVWTRPPETPVTVTVAVPSTA